MTESVKIKCDDCKFVDDCVDYGWDGCKKFTQKASEPLTNEEWLHTLNTEQLAEFINYIACQCSINKPCKLCNGWCHKDDVEKWLKQPHTS